MKHFGSPFFQKCSVSITTICLVKHIYRRSVYIPNTKYAQKVQSNRSHLRKTSSSRKFMVVSTWKQCHSIMSTTKSNNLTQLTTNLIHIIHPQCKTLHSYGPFMTIISITMLEDKANCNEPCQTTNRC